MRLLWRHMAGGVVVTLALLVLLACNVVLAVAPPFGHVWIAQLAIVAVMVFTVLWFSMEVRLESGLVQLFAGLGFFWVAILFGLTLIDVLTREGSASS